MNGPGFFVDENSIPVPRRCLRNIVELHMDQALHEISADPGILWDLTYVPLGEGAAGSVTAIIVFVAPSTIMGQYITLGAVINPHKLLDYDTVLDMTRRLVEQIRTLRTQALKTQ